MAEVKLNTEKMVSFRLETDRERELRLFLVKQQFSLHHLCNAFIEKVIAYSQDRLTFDYEIKTMEKIMARSLDLRFHTKYERAEKMRIRHAKKRSETKPDLKNES